MREKYFIEDDKLERKKYADFLNTIICNSNKYKRDEFGKSYTIAIDSSWGTGKTYFLDMFVNYLLGNDGQNTTNSNDFYKVIRFDAWKNDFWNNAFEPFVASILENDLFYDDVENQNAEELLKGFLKSSFIIAKGIVKKKVEDYIDSESLEQAINQTVKDGGNFFLHNQESFSGYYEFRNEINNFKNILGKFIGEDIKLVIIIDELDRCKPVFAIQLLEIVKHLFDIEGVTFLFMLDIEQLSYSVKTVYGEGMDATGYLCRFFDYITRMPKPDTRKYIINSFEDVTLYKYCGAKEKDQFINYFYELSESWSLSLRDIDTIVCSYRIMLDSFLKEYMIIDAHCMYLFFLVLKYKDINLFNEIFIKGNVPEKINSISSKDIFRGAIVMIRNMGTLIKDINHVISTRNEPDGMTYFQNKLFVYSVEENDIKAKISKKSMDIISTEILYDTKLCICREKIPILFAPDIKKWNQIKEKKYGYYIHQQLEMFNFVTSSRNE